MIGKMIQKKRQENSETQEQLADSLGVSRQTIINWEKEKTIPDSNSLIAIANHYQVSLDSLCGTASYSKTSRVNLLESNWKRLLTILLLLISAMFVNVQDNTFIPILITLLLSFYLLSDSYRILSERQSHETHL